MEGCVCTIQLELFLFALTRRGPHLSPLSRALDLISHKNLAAGSRGALLPKWAKSHSNKQQQFLWNFWTDSFILSRTHFSLLLVTFSNSHPLMHHQFLCCVFTYCPPPVLSPASHTLLIITLPTTELLNCYKYYAYKNGRKIQRN